jgi:hypothetical protein
MYLFLLSVAKFYENPFLVFLTVLFMLNEFCHHNRRTISFDFVTLIGTILV